MQRPTCAEAAKFYTDLIEARSEFETLYLLAQEFDLTKDKQKFRNVMNKKEEIDRLWAGFVTKYGFLRWFVDFDGIKITPPEATALDNLFGEIEFSFIKLAGSDMERFAEHWDVFEIRKLHKSRVTVDDLHVVALNLDNLVIPNVPREIKYLPNLRSLSMTNNAISDMSEFSDLIQLEELSIGDTSANSFGKNFDALKKLVNLKKLTVVNFLPADKKFEFIEYWKKRLGDEFKYSEQW